MANNKYSKETLTDAVAKSDTWADVCREMGVKPGTGAQSYLTRRAKELGLDHSHFVGKKTNKGSFQGFKNPIEHYLRKDFFTKSHDLRLRLIKEGMKEAKCEYCGTVEWMGKPVPLELEHKDGDHQNNLFENLAIICPNCHAQTDTHAGKNIGKKKNRGSVG